MEVKTIHGSLFRGTGINGYLSLDDPISCPFCHKGIEHQPVYFLKNNDTDIQIFMKCNLCNKSFIGYSAVVGGGSSKETYRIYKLSKGNSKIRKFNEIINNLSENFVKIYGEAEVAENNDLLEICGIGYRKALEFLIKDYTISLSEEQEHEKIKNISLGTCIENYINNEKIKNISKRAVWIGNDETHYIRKWKDKDLQDLKKLIDIVLNYIIMETKANQYIEEMN